MNRLKQWGLCLGLAGALLAPASADPELEAWPDQDGWQVEWTEPEGGSAEPLFSNEYDQSDYEEYRQSYRSYQGEEEAVGDYPRYRDGRDPAGYYPVDDRPYEQQGDESSPNGAFPDRHDTWGGPPDKAPQE